MEAVEECAGICELFPPSLFAPDLELSSEVGAGVRGVVAPVPVVFPVALAAATFFRISGAPSLRACEVFS